MKYFLYLFLKPKLRDELFVGISKRSTAKGADYLEKVFQIPVHHIAVEGSWSKSSKYTIPFQELIIHFREKIPKFLITNDFPRKNFDQIEKTTFI